MFWNSRCADDLFLDVLAAGPAPASAPRTWPAGPAASRPPPAGFRPVPPGCGIASIPKRNPTPSASQRSRCSVWVKSVSPAQQDLAETRPGGTTAIARSQPGRRALVAGPVAAAIDHEQRLARVGQRDHQRVVAPLRPCRRCPCPRLHSPVVGAIVPSASMMARSKNACGWLPPDLQPHLVDRVHQDLNVALVEPPAEVPCRRRVGNPLGPQGIQVDLVVTPQFEVLQARRRRTGRL